MIEKILLFILMLPALAACGHRSGGDAAQSGQTGTRTLAVSIEPLRAMLEPLAAGRFEVVGIMDRSADAESFEPSVSRRMAAEKAAGVFLTGMLPFEKSLAASLPDSVAAVDLSRSVDLIYGTHDHDGGHADADHKHGSPDPHIWTSARNARRIVAAMAAELTRLDPAGAALYAARRDSIDRGLRALDEYADSLLREAPARSFLVWHPSLSYFARDYGLRQVALGMEGKDMSASQLRGAIETARSSGARVFLMERGADTGRARSISAEVGARAVEIDPMSAEWQEQIKLMADELARH